MLSWETSRTCPVRCPDADGSLIVGKCGDDIGDDEAVDAARVVGLTMLATMRQQFGSLDHIERVVKVERVFVNCTLDYAKQPAVVNGLANLFIDVFGPAGKGGRSAVGSSGLPWAYPWSARPSSSSSPRISQT